MKKYDFSRGAYKAGPKHVIVEAGLRREVARVHHEEDLQMVLRAIESHDDLVAALKRFTSYGKTFAYREADGCPIEQALAALAKAEGPDR